MGIVNGTVTALSKLVGKKVFKTFEDVERMHLRHHPHADRSFLNRAYTFAREAHEGQARRSGEPYITHPVSVAYILAKSKLDTDTVAAGFLHDVVEDCGVTVPELNREFNEDVGRILDGVTKIGNVNFQDKNQAQAENYRKMIMAMSQDVRVLIVKLADRVHNMRTLDAMPSEKQKRKGRETIDIFIPLAHRVGMSNLKADLERLAFRYTEPEAFEELSRQLAEREKKQGKFLSNVTKELERILTENSIEAEVSSRVKSKYSIYRKMQRKNCALETLFDYYAFRIITHTVEDCYKVFGLLHARWRHIPGRIKDFIATPKSNLYQSIHTTLISSEGQPFEVQVRTHAMHRIAEEGVAAHWTYKDGRLLNVGKNEFANWLKRVADDQKEVSDSDEFLETIKGQLGAREILVFTPNEEIKTLPAGATPLDFAYLIHTEVGHRAAGAKVDGKMVPLRSELESGSIVEIITKNAQKPTEEWLQWVKTHSARAKIRSFLRADEKAKAVEEGRTLFEKELKRQKIPLKSVKTATIQSHLDHFGKRKIDDFYAAIGFGTVSLKNAVKPFLPDVEEVEAQQLEELKEERFQRKIEKVTRKNKQLVRVTGMSDIDVRFAKCCNPILGDEIIGYITQGQGISVHKKDCRTFEQQNVNPDRKVAVTWEKGEQRVFLVTLRAFTEERSGMVAAITNAISETRTTMQKLDASVNEDREVGVFEITLQIHTLDHLNKVLTKLRRVKGVLSVERLNN